MNPHALQTVPRLMDEAIVPGMQIAVISGGEVEVHAFGVANVQTGAPVTDDTVFEAASLGKPVAAYGLLLLASAGRIDLDAPVGRYVPDLPPAVSALTARQLLSHRGGLPNQASGGGFANPVSPGQRFSYSGEGFRLLQRVIEAVAGQPFQDYVQQAVFTPLGMTASSFVWREDYAQRKAFGHSSTGSSAGRSRIPEARAASSLETTAGDYARFLIALSRGTGLSPEIARQALTKQAAVEQGCAVCLGRTAGAPVPDIAWGLGIGLAELPSGRVAWHWGDNQTMQSYAALSLDGRRGTVILTNSANGHSIAREIAASILGFDAPGYAWVGSYAAYTEPGRQALSRIVDGAPGAAAAAAQSLPRTEAVALAERLLAGDRPAEAAALVSALSTPRSAGELALLAEALRQSGRPAEARSAAAEALVLEPANARARQVTEWIALAERQVPAEALARYAGRYSSPFGPLEVTQGGGRLTARLLDQPPSAMLPLSERSFLIERMGVPIAFVAGPDGRITHAIVTAGGEFSLPRID